MTVTITQLFKTFSKAVNENAATELTTYLEENKTEGLATKEDINTLRTTAKEDIARLEILISNYRVSMIIWAISLMVIQTGIVLGFLYFMLKK